MGNIKTGYPEETLLNETHVSLFKLLNTPAYVPVVYDYKPMHHHLETMCIIYTI